MSHPRIEHSSQRGRKLAILLLCLVLAAGVLLFDLFTPLGIASGVPYIVVVLVSLWSPWRGFTIVTALLTSLLSITGFFLSPPGGELWKVLYNRSISFLAIWITAALTLQRKKMAEKREEAIREREKTLEDIKILRGLLPICASCKRIRDDQGYWGQLEEYISAHSEADFSHGLCPDCAVKLYPEIFRKAPDESGKRQS